MEVTITHGFYLSTTEITERQWLVFMSRLPEKPGNVYASPRGQDCPVAFVTWYECLEFCRRLANSDGKRYRLPTTAEWEYACKAGTNTSVYGPPELIASSNHWEGLPIQPVKLKQPNAFGLYDMLGGVAEWCLDSFSTSRAEGTAVEDPFRVDEEGIEPWRNACGGWGTGRLNSTQPTTPRPSSKSGRTGFRILMSADGEDLEGSVAWSYHQRYVAEPCMETARKQWGKSRSGIR